MMVALLLYAYARGNRSARGIERACVEDVAYRVVAGNLVPDHSTIAEFRCRHERALGEVFSRRARALRAGGAGVGRGGGDRRHEDVGQRVDQRQPRLRADRPRDPRRGGGDRSSRGRALRHASAATSCPSICAPARGGARRCARPRNAWSASAARRPSRPTMTDDERGGGRARSAAVRDASAGPAGVAARGPPRAGRRARARRRARSRRSGPIGCSRRVGAWRKSSTSSTRPTRPMRRGGRAASPPTGRAGWRPGWSSRTSRRSRRPGWSTSPITTRAWSARTASRRCRATTRRWRSTTSQIVVAAEITTESPDFGHLEPMVRATQRELRAIELGDPDVVLADAGYWHQRQIEAVVSDGMQVLVPPDGGLRKGARPGWTGGLYDFMRRVLATPDGPRPLPPAPDHHRARVRPDQVQPRDQTLPTPRQSRPAEANGG